MEAREEMKAQMERQRVAFEGEVSQLKKLLEDMETTVLEQQDKIQVMENSGGGSTDCAGGPAGDVVFTNNKGDAIGGLSDVSLEALGLISKMDEIKIDDLDCKVVSRSMAVSSDDNGLCLTLKTSHASTAKASKDPVTRKWVPAGTKVETKKAKKK